MQHDFFICHASEDKEDFVRPLANLLKQQNIDVWYDEFSLNIGDSLTQKIDEGLSKSKFGIVVISPDFFNKPWAKRELNGLTFREMLEKRELILPIWHRVSAEEVANYSLPLADKKAASSSDGINTIIRNLIKKINPNNSPLIIARDHLISLNTDPPPISDEWWLDIIEYKEFLKYPDLNNQKRWIFPLPYKYDDRGKERGINIASAALQLDWSFEGEELNLDCTSHPDKVHEFIHRWPGLYECARKNPKVLALYVPQLTIPGFDSGFVDVFDEILEPNEAESSLLPHSRRKTINGDIPLCTDIIALRHPLLGNYTPEELGHQYFSAHDTCYFRTHATFFEGLVWLVSNDSNWLPEKYRQTFIEGILTRDQWARRNFLSTNPFWHALIMKGRKQFKLTNTVKKGLYDLIENAANNLGIIQSSEEITKTLLNIGLIDSYYTYQDWVRNQKLS